MGEWVKECADKYATEIIPVSCDICDFQAVKQMIIQIKRKNEDILMSW